MLSCRRMTEPGSGNEAETHDVVNLEDELSGQSCAAPVAKPRSKVHDHFTLKVQDDRYHCNYCRLDYFLYKNTVPYI